MPRAKVDFVKFSFETTQRLIDEAANISRWSGVTAINWMKEAELLVNNEMLAKHWNKRAKYINDTIDSIESKIYFNESEYWEDNPSERLVYMEENIINLEEYLKHV